MSVGREPGRPTDRRRPHRRPTTPIRTPPDNNPWRDKIRRWIEDGCPTPWEEPLDDIPEAYGARVKACNRLRLAWRHQLERDGLEWREYNTQFVQDDDGRWWFKWWSR